MLTTSLFRSGPTFDGRRQIVEGHHQQLHDHVNAAFASASAAIQCSAVAALDIGLSLFRAGQQQSAADDDAVECVQHDASHLRWRMSR